MIKTDWALCDDQLQQRMDTKINGNDTKHIQPLSHNLKKYTNNEIKVKH